MSRPSPAAIAGLAIAGTAIAGVAAYGVLNREKAQQFSKSFYDSIAAGASTAATKSSEALKAVQSSASASYTSVAGSFNNGINSLKTYVTPRKYRRVKSFPVKFTEEDDVMDVAAGKKQRRLKDNNKGSPKKPAAHKQGKAPITLQVTAQ